MKNISITLMAIVISVFTSCSYDVDFEIECADLPYLTLADDADFNDLSEEEVQILLAAAQRFKIQVNKEGLYELSVKSAKEINVSEPIFNFFLNIIDSSNDNMFLYRNRLIGRSGQNDCSIYALQYATGLGYYYIANHVIAITDGVGVTDKNRDMVFCDPMFGGRSVDISSFNAPEVLGDRFIIIFRDPELMDEKTWHAVNGYWQTDGQTFTCVDHQTGTNWIVSKSMIKSIYCY